MKIQNVCRQYSPSFGLICALLSISLVTSSCGSPVVEDETFAITQEDSFKLTRVEDVSQVKDSEVLTFLCESMTTKPDVATPNCADFGEAVFDIKWSHWSAKGSEGEGTYSINDCNPDCASGTRSSTSVYVFLNDLYSDGNRYFLRNFSFAPKNKDVRLQVSEVWDLADFYITVPEMRADS